jgi:hypothetical protein
VISLEMANHRLYGCAAAHLATIGLVTRRT